MLGLKLNHVSKRGTWSVSQFRSEVQQKDGHMERGTSEHLISATPNPNYI